ncbi:hypothetical protein KBC54_04575 [Patescibacteria group bacterium]|nr:hypothetical protein [Patescibacteria group bacterium]
MKRLLASFCALCLVIPQAMPFLPAQAQQLVLDPGFDPNRILQDEDIFNVTGMTYSQMVQFMRTRGPLADTMLTDIDGVKKPASQIIWRVTTSYKLNPKYLLALIQKEQSLVEDPDPIQKQFDWAAGYGVCDNCSKDDPSIQDFKGFASQLEWAAKQHREKYLMQILGNGQTRAGKAAGKTMTVDGMSVTPTNNATAMLYSYTPHLHGNLNLWRIWRRWFSLSYPDGSIVRGTPSGKAYLIRLGQKRAFESRAVLESLVDPNKILTASDTDLSAYLDGPSIQFPKFALLKDPKGKMWLLTEGGRRQIVDMKAFRKFDFNEDELIDVTEEDLTDYDIEAPITVKTEFPQGKVLQDKTTKTYWYVEDQTRHLIPSSVFLSLYFQGRVIKPVTPTKLATYTVGEPYQLHDSELVRGVKQTSVYVVENGKLRPIPSAEVFETIGWKWKNVVTVADKVLADYPIGDMIALESALAVNASATPTPTSTSPLTSTSTLSKL